MTVNFNDYTSSPEEIVQIITLLNTPQEKEALTKYNKNDIDIMIANEIIIINHEGKYINSESKFANIYSEYQKCYGKLKHVIGLKFKIEILEIAWLELSEYINSIAKKIILSQGKLHVIVTQDDMNKIEFKITNLLSAILTVRDFLKKRFVHVNKQNNITNQLIDKYSLYTEKYQKLLKSTIEQNNIYTFTESMRNKILHGGLIKYQIITHHFQNEIISSIFCDLKSLYEDSNFSKVRDLLLAHYHDKTISLLKKCVQFNRKDIINDEDIKDIDSDLKIRTNNQYINFKNLSISQIKSLLMDKSFVLFVYDRFKDKETISSEQFSIALSDLIGKLYESYITLYDNLYSWIANTHNTEIKEFIDAHNKLKSYNGINVEMNNDLTFKLNINKSNIYHD